jgi:hypothetical protein
LGVEVLYTGGVWESKRIFRIEDVRIQRHSSLYSIPIAFISGPLTLAKDQGRRR